jgi:hypothetical protein
LQIAAFSLAVSLSWPNVSSVLSPASAAEPESSDVEEPENAAAWREGEDDHRIDELMGYWIWDDDSCRLATFGDVVRERLDAELKTLQTIGSLDEQQCLRLRLAGTIDVQLMVVRCRELYEECRQAAVEGRHFFKTIFQRSRPLRLQTRHGLFQADSLFRRLLPKTISSEQLREIQQEEQAAREYEFQALLDQPLIAAEQNLILTVEQHARLEELCQRRLKRPRRASLRGFDVLMYQMSQIPEEELRPILNVRQLRNWKHSLKQIELDEELIEELRANQLWREDPPDAQTDTAEQQPPPAQKAAP